MYHIDGTEINLLASFITDQLLIIFIQIIPTQHKNASKNNSGNKISILLWDGLDFSN